MYIGEIPDGSSIEINVSSEDKKLSLCTFARAPKNPVDEKMMRVFYKKNTDIRIILSKLL